MSAQSIAHAVHLAINNLVVVQPRVNSVLSVPAVQRVDVIIVIDVRLEDMVM